MRMTRHFKAIIEVEFVHRAKGFVVPEDIRDVVKEKFAESHNIDLGDCDVRIKEVSDHLDKDDVIYEELSRIENTLEKALKEKGMSAYAVILEYINDSMMDLLAETFEDYNMADSIPGKFKHIGGCKWYSVDWKEEETLDRHEEYYMSKEGKTWIFWMVELDEVHGEDRLYRLIETQEYHGSEEELSEDMLGVYCSEAWDTGWLDWPHEPDGGPLFGRARGGDILSSERIQDIHDSSFDFDYRAYGIGEGDVDGETH